MKMKIILFKLKRNNFNENFKQSTFIKPIKRL
jgi:hypothetical protein